MMANHTPFFSIVLFLLLSPVHTNAQKVYKVNRFVDSLLTKRYWRANIDTNYIIRPKTKWTLMGQLNVSGTTINTRGKYDEGINGEIEFRADKKTTFSLNISYVGVSLSLSINPARMSGKYKDTELGFRSYGKRFGFDLTYHDSYNFVGEYKIGDNTYDFTTSGDQLRLQTTNINAYYVFSPRRFSYPAAFSHSYIQRRSAGSFMLAGSLQSQNGEMNYNGEKSEFKINNYALGGGYGYNYVPGHGWLIHISTLPTLIVGTKTTFIDFDGTQSSLTHKFPEMIVTSRLAIVKQIGSNKFAGLSTVFTFTHVGDEENIAFRNYKWNSRLYFGFRL